MGPNSNGTLIATRASWGYKTLVAAEASDSIVLSVTHHAANSLTLGTGQDSGEAASRERGISRNTFSAVQQPATTTASFEL